MKNEATTAATSSSCKILRLAVPVEMAGLLRTTIVEHLLTMLIKLSSLHQPAIVKRQRFQSLAAGTYGHKLVNIFIGTHRYPVNRLKCRALSYQF
jgi:hypothetical protein